MFWAAPRVTNPRLPHQDTPTPERKPLASLTQHPQHSASCPGSRRLGCLRLRSPHRGGDLLPAQLQADEDVDDGDDAHRQDEEDEGGHLEDVGHPLLPLGRNVAQQGIRHRLPVTWVRHEIEQARVDWVGQGACAGNQPDGDDALDGAWLAAAALAADRVADGDVALDGEARDGQHRGVGCHLHQEDLEDAEELPEVPWVRLPDGEQLRGQRWKPNKHQREGKMFTKGYRRTTHHSHQTDNSELHKELHEQDVNK